MLQKVGGDPKIGLVDGDAAVLDRIRAKYLIGESPREASKCLCSRQDSARSCSRTQIPSSLFSRTPASSLSGTLYPLSPYLPLPTCRTRRQPPGSHSNHTANFTASSHPRYAELPSSQHAHLTTSRARCAYCGLTTPSAQLGRRRFAHYSVNGCYSCTSALCTRATLRPTPLQIRRTPSTRHFPRRPPLLVHYGAKRQSRPYVRVDLCFRQRHPFPALDRSTPPSPTSPVSAWRSRIDAPMCSAKSSMCCGGL